MDDFGDVLGQLVDMEMASAAAASGLGGLAGGALYAVATDLLRRDVKAEDIGKGKLLPTGTSLTNDKGEPNRVPYLATPGMRMLGAAVLGIVGGRLAWELNPDAAKGYVGYNAGQIGDGLYNMVMGKRTQRRTLDNVTGDTEEIRNQLLTAEELNGFSGALAGAGQLRAAEVFPEQDGVFADAEVEDFDDMAGTIEAVSAY